MGKPRLHSYTDGSCPVNPGPGGWAYAIVGEDVGLENTLGSGFAPYATNNTMEMMGVYKVMRKLIKLDLHKTHNHFIWSDSRYVVTGMQVWRHNWELDGWTNKNGELWCDMHEVAKQFDNLRLQWLRGHVGHYWNERVDAMAGDACKHGRRQLVSMFN